MKRKTSSVPLFSTICSHTRFYLNSGSAVWSLLSWADTRLCHSSQNVPSLTAAVSTLSEPSEASGQHPLCPTEMGLFLQNIEFKDKYRQHATWLIKNGNFIYFEKIHKYLCKEVLKSGHLTHSAFQVDATGPRWWEERPKELDCWGGEAHLEAGSPVFPSLRRKCQMLCFLAATHPHTWTLVCSCTKSESFK